MQRNRDVFVGKKVRIIPQIVQRSQSPHCAPLCPPVFPQKPCTRVMSSTAPISGCTMVCRMVTTSRCNVSGFKVLGFRSIGWFVICEIQPNEDNRKYSRPRLTCLLELVGDPLKTFVKTLTRRSASGLDILFYALARLSIGVVEGSRDCGIPKSAVASCGGQACL